MKKLCFGAMLLSLTLGAQAQEPIHELLDILGGRQNVSKIQQQFVQTATRKNPELQSYEAVLTNWAQEFLTWQAVSDELELIYTSHYNDQEIKDLLDFYRTPTGKKSVELMPVLFQEGAQIGNKITLRHEEELRARLKKAIQIQQSQ